MDANLQTVVNTLIAAGVVGAVGGVLKNYSDVRLMKEQVGILWKMMETQALGALHHAVQPEMDAMLEGYAKGTLDLSQLRQLIQRLEIIKSGQSFAPEQVPAASLLLEAAKAQLAARLKHPEVLDAAEEALRHESDRRMAEATAAESAVAYPKPPAFPPAASPPPGSVAGLERASGELKEASEGLREAVDKHEEAGAGGEAQGGR